MSGANERSESSIVTHSASDSRSTFQNHQSADGVPPCRPTGGRAVTKGVGVVVLYYRAGSTLLATLEALESQSRPPAGITVIDNASHDGFCDQALRLRFPNVRFHTTDENLGYAGGMNAGADLVSTETILFLTHEVRLAPDALERMADHIAANPRAVVGPTLARTSSGITWSAGGEILRSGGVRHRTDRSAASECSWIDGACIMVRRDLFEELKGFDEQYFLYWEDVDFGYRASQVATVTVLPGVRASQETGTTPVYWGTRNRIYMWRKHRRPTKLAMAVAVPLAKVVVRDLPSRDFRRSKARLVGIAHGFTGSLAVPSWETE